MDVLNFDTVPEQSTDRTDRDDFSYDSTSTLPSPSIPLSPSSDTGSTRSAARVHHARYFIKDDMTVFLVGDEILFRVHRHYLDRESDIFRSYPSGTEDNPIPLPGVLPEEFEVLVEYFYDSVHGNVSRSSNQWTHLLSVSTRFKMEKVRQRAITELETFQIDPIDKIIIAVKNGVSVWLEPAYVELCQREEPIRGEEAEMLGLHTAMKLACAREYVRDPVWVHKNPAPEPIATQSVQSIDWGFNHGADVIPESDGPKDKRLDTTHVKRVVRLVFWPGSPSAPEWGRWDRFLTESDGGPSKKQGKKKKGQK